MHIGHGGTLLAIPDEVDWENELGDAQSLFKGGPVPCTLVRDALLDASQQERDKFNRMPPKVHAAVNAGDRAAQVLGRQLYTSTDNAVEGCLDWLAQLTATDGMTIVRSDLTVLAFGVIIQARSDSEDPRIVRQGLFRGDSHRYSTRGPWRGPAPVGCAGMHQAEGRGRLRGIARRRPHNHALGRKVERTRSDAGLGASAVARAGERRPWRSKPHASQRYPGSRRSFLLLRIRLFSLLRL